MPGSTLRSFCIRSSFAAHTDVCSSRVVMRVRKSAAGIEASACLAACFFLRASIVTTSLSWRPSSRGGSAGAGSSAADGRVGEGEETGGTAVCGYWTERRRSVDALAPSIVSISRLCSAASWDEKASACSFPKMLKMASKSLHRIVSSCTEFLAVTLKG